MKIPFTKYHIVKEQDVESLRALRYLASDFVPDIELLITALHEAKVGASAHGRRKKQRKVFQRAYSLKQALKFETDESMPDGEVLMKFPEGQEHKNVRIVNIG